MNARHHRSHFDVRLEQRSRRACASTRVRVFTRSAFLVAAFWATACRPRGHEPPAGTDQRARAAAADVAPTIVPEVSDGSIPDDDSEADTPEATGEDEFSARLAAALPGAKPCAAHDPRCPEDSLYCLCDEATRRVLTVWDRESENPYDAGPDGKGDSWTIVTYDEAGRCIAREDDHRGDSSWVTRDTLSYDDQGRLVRESTAGTDGRIFTATARTYDAGGSLTAEVREGRDGTVEERTDYVPGPDGKPRRAKHFYRDEEGPGTTTSYLDDRENPVRVDRDRDGDGKADLRTRLRRNGRGSVIETQQDWLADGTVDWRVLRELDETGRCVAEAHDWNADGKVEASIRPDCDDPGSDPECWADGALEPGAATILERSADDAASIAVEPCPAALPCPYGADSCTCSADSHLLRATFGAGALAVELDTFDRPGRLVRREYFQGGEAQWRIWYAYDGSGRKVQEVLEDTKEDGNIQFVRRHEYLSNGMRRATTMERGCLMCDHGGWTWERNTYDRAGRLALRENSDGQMLDGKAAHLVRFAYTSGGLLLRSESVGYGEAAPDRTLYNFVRDADDRLVRLERDGQTIEFTYDTDGNPVGPPPEDPFVTVLDERLDAHGLVAEQIVYELEETHRCFSEPPYRKLLLVWPWSTMGTLQRERTCVEILDTTSAASQPARPAIPVPQPRMPLDDFLR
jgi:hypothetical protein